MEYNSSISDEIIITPPSDAARSEKPSARKVVFDKKVIGEVLADFLAAKPNETACLLSGPIDQETGTLKIVRKWPAELDSATPFHAKVKLGYWARFRKMIAEQEPSHNGVIEAHIHPIGKAMSGTDRDGLRVLCDWGDHTAFCMIACDIQLGVYTYVEDAMIEIRSEVEKDWRKEKEQTDGVLNQEERSSGHEIQTSTFVRLLRKIMGRSRKEG